MSSLRALVFQGVAALFMLSNREDELASEGVKVSQGM
jgi:hypothetical protein